MCMFNKYFKLSFIRSFFSALIKISVTVMLSFAFGQFSIIPLLCQHTYKQIKLGFTSMRLLFLLFIYAILCAQLMGQQPLPTLIETMCAKIVVTKEFRTVRIRVEKNANKDFYYLIELKRYFFMFFFSRCSHKYFAF